ncbi:MAG: HisA/HisF-related TIM barrel protein [Hyphomicrobium sp.]
MLVIPVLDLKAGAVVHARGGKRAAYRPIETPLAPGTSDPVAILAGLLGVFPFRTVYIADLDGIAGRGRNHDTTCALRLEVPAVTFWVDDGSATPAAVGAMARMPNVRPVVGTETLRGLVELDTLHRLGTADAILSLDFKGGALLGPPEILEYPDRWPQTIIAMTLAHVGADQGPDLPRVRDIVRRAGAGRQVFAAGGVRDKADLVALRAAGATGVLVASALHSGKIKAGDLEEIAGQ